MPRRTIMPSAWRVATLVAFIALAAPLGAQNRRSNPGVGETDKFGARITGVAYDPERVTYELQRPAFVTLLIVDSDRIFAIFPGGTGSSKIEVAGSHVAGLIAMASGKNRADVVGNAPGIAKGSVTAAEYERCMTRAAQIARNQAANRRVVVGRDSAGRPIYGPAEVSMDDQVRGEAICNNASRNSTSMQAPIRQNSVAAKKGRYLFLYATDTPVDVKMVEALAITENDPKLMALSMGKKLFGVSGAIWAGYYTGW